MNDKLKIVVCICGGAYFTTKGIIGLYSGSISLAYRGGAGTTFVKGEALKISLLMLLPGLVFLYMAIKRILDTYFKK